MNFKIHQFPVETTFDHHGYDEVDKCIYCGSTPPYLTKEHIIGKALNGTLTIKRASCKCCQNITRGIEEFCFGHMRYFRLRHNFRSSRKPPFKIPTRYLEEPAGIIEMTRNELPGILIIPTAPPPTKFFGPWPTPQSGGAFQFISSMKWPKDTVFSMPPFQIQTYGRFIAKIAHGYACAEIGIDNFKPLLPGIIKNTTSNPFELIGCLSQHSYPPKEDFLHQMSLECWENGMGLYLVVKIRLLAYIGAPEYHAVVGLVNSIPEAALKRVFISKVPKNAHL